MTTVPAVIDALVAGLTSRLAAQSDVLVSDGLPAVDLTGRRLLTVGGQEAPTAEGTQVWASLGTSRRTEDYILRLYATSVVGGTSQKEARDRAYSLVTEVSDYLRANPSLGGLLDGEGIEMGSAFTLSQHHADLRDDDGNPVGGRWAEVAFDVHVRTRI